MHYPAFTHNDWEKSLNNSLRDCRCRSRNSKRATPEHDSEALSSMPTSTSATRSALWGILQIFVSPMKQLFWLCVPYITTSDQTNSGCGTDLRVPIMTAPSTWWMPPCWHSHGVVSVQTQTQIANPIYCVLQQNNFPIRNWWPTRCNFLVYLFVPSHLYMFRVKFSPIIRSTRLYLQLLI